MHDMGNCNQRRCGLKKFVGGQEVAIFRQRRSHVLKISILPQNFRKNGDFQLRILYFWKNIFREEHFTMG